LAVLFRNTASAGDRFASTRQSGDPAFVGNVLLLQNWSGLNGGYAIRAWGIVVSGV